MLKPETILETHRLWAVFLHGNLTFLSLQGPPSRDETNSNKGDPDHVTVDLSKDICRDSVQHSSAETMLVWETYHFLHTGTHHMPLDFSSFTRFQQMVFAEVLKIPPGTTTTYKGIASRLGNPRASRAVGTALSLNPVAYFLPTHRVLPSTRGIGTCKSGAGHLREKLLKHEGLDLDVLKKLKR